MRAVLSLVRMVEGESVIRMRDEGLAALLDILERGSVRDIMRFAGAVMILVFASGRKLEVRRKWDEKRVLTENGLGSNKIFSSILVVEIRHTFPGKFEMLALIFTNWNVCCSASH